MSPLQNTTEAGEYFSRSSGQFFNPNKDLQPGQSVEVTLLDLTENHQTKYPIPGKTYCYRLRFSDPQGTERIMDMSGKDAISQAVKALYPDGITKGLKPGAGVITRRAQRTTKQASYTITRTTDDERLTV